MIYSVDVVKELLDIGFSEDRCKSVAVPLCLIESMELLGNTFLPSGPAEIATINFTHADQSENSSLVALICQLFEALSDDWRHSSDDQNPSEFQKWPPWGREVAGDIHHGIQMVDEVRLAAGVVVQNAKLK